MFPKGWLMLYRWGKRRKGEKQKTSDGYLVEHVTVGGRTSSYVPELQKLKKRVEIEDTTRKVKKEEMESDENKKESSISEKSSKKRKTSNPSLKSPRQSTKRS